MTFRSYSLIRLNTALGNTDIATVCDYDVTIINNFGRSTTKTMKLNHIDRDWCELRMNGDRFAKLDGGKCFPITEAEFYRLQDDVEITNPLELSA